MPVVSRTDTDICINRPWASLFSHALEQKNKRFERATGYATVLPTAGAGVTSGLREAREFFFQSSVRGVRLSGCCEGWWEGVWSLLLEAVVCGVQM